jgi:dTDP-4-amino-4,6-dideoxygalactose transaminase
MPNCKESFSELAIFGAPPAFSSPIHVGKPNIGNRETFMKRMNDILDRKWLTNGGPMVDEFETALRNLTGVKHCIAMCNGTVALEIAIRALGLKGEVIVPSFTFIATAHALQWQEITPVFCDINSRTHTIDPLRAEELITPRTTGIIGVHLWGRPCDIDGLSELCQRRNLKLMFDAAHALGVTYKGKNIGSFGNAEVLSFHATKIVNSFEGGAILTDDDELAKKIRLMKNFGFVHYDDVDYIGTNGKMSEASAAMGLTGLESLGSFKDANFRNYKKYKSGLAGLKGVSLISYDENEKNNYHYVVAEIDDRITHITRDQIYAAMHAEKVLVRRYFYPGCHNMEPYRSYFPHAGMLLPQTETLAKKVLVLPTGPSLDEEDVECICQIIRTLITNSEEILRRWR